MTTFDPAAYGPAIQKLLLPPRLPALAVEAPPQAMHAELEALSNDAAFAPLDVRDRHMAAACRAGLWLLFDFLDEAHQISQDLDTPEGCYWHALVHRREPDFDNSKYWFRRVGRHAVFDPLRDAAARLAAQAADTAPAFLGPQNDWDPFAFVDLCRKAAAGHGSYDTLCRQIQSAEWELLFEYCHRHATGRM